MPFRTGVQFHRHRAPQEPPEKAPASSASASTLGLGSATIDLAQGEATVSLPLVLGDFGPRYTSHDNLRPIMALETQLPLAGTGSVTGTRQRVVPGHWRESDVAVGRHYAVSPGAVVRFMERFEVAYGRLGRLDSVLAAAAAHNRLLWIHPFADGNGRVARLMSHAMLKDSIDTCGIWSIARGLARHETAYKDHLEECDQPRRGDLDGRGALSEVKPRGWWGRAIEPHAASRQH